MNLIAQILIAVLCLTLLAGSIWRAWNKHHKAWELELVRVMLYPVYASNVGTATREEQILKFKRNDGTVFLVSRHNSFYFYENGIKASWFEANKIEEAIRRYNFPIYVERAKRYEEEITKLSSQLLTGSLTPTADLVKGPKNDSGTFH